MRPPSNIIIPGKYTIGDEFMLASSKIDYQGYYYEFQGKFFAGKTFNILAPEIVKKEPTFEMPFEGEDESSRIISFMSTSSKFPSLPLNDPNNPVFLALDIQENTDSFRYFAKQVNTSPILIKEISKETFNSLQLNPLYQTLAIPIRFIEDPVSLEKVNKIMFGIKDFLMS
jgi:hypothetical protein